MQVSTEMRRELALLATEILEQRVGLRDDFPSLLRSYRERAGRSRNGLAVEICIDPGYLTKCEHGHRDPPRPYIIEALARALRLSPPERNRLLVAAGFAPPALIGAWDDALQAVTDVLNDVHLSPEERDEFRSVVRLIAARWRGGAELSPRFAS